MNLPSVTIAATHSIKLGEKYQITLSARDADGAAILLDGTWTARYRVTAGEVDGETVEEGVMAIADGSASKELDTAAEGWGVGTYYYDCCAIDEDGYATWTDPVKLILLPRNARPTA